MASSSRHDSSVEIYKDCLGIETSVAILCDSTYILCMHTCNKDPRAINKLQHDITRAFGVKNITLHATQCVFDELRGALINDDWLNIAPTFYLEPCKHHEPSLDSKACLIRMVEIASARPFVVASTDSEFCTKIAKSTGVPVLSVVEGVITIMPLVKGQLKKLKGIKRSHLFELLEPHQRDKKISKLVKRKQEIDWEKKRLRRLQRQKRLTKLYAAARVKLWNMKKLAEEKKKKAQECISQEQAQGCVSQEKAQGS